MLKRIALTLATVAIIVVGSAHMKGHPQSSGAEAAPNYHILFPVRAVDGNWWACQGYNNTAISHYGGDRYALDLIPSRSAVGTTGCHFTTAAVGRNVITPVDGWVSWKSDSIGMVCINLRSGNTPLNMSMRVGHMKTRAATASAPAEWRSVPVGGKVHQGATLGYVAAANEVANGGVGHVHISVYKGNGCSSASPVPFSSSYGTALEGMSCATYTVTIFSLPSNGTFNQYAGSHPVCIGGVVP